MQIFTLNYIELTLNKICVFQSNFSKTTACIRLRVDVSRIQIFN